MKEQPPPTGTFSHLTPAEFEQIKRQQLEALSEWQANQKKDIAHGR